MKIVILDAATVTNGDLGFSSLTKFGKVVRYDLTLPERTAERIRDADIVLLNKVELTRENMANAANLKYIGLFATGYNNVDIAYAKEKGIVVANVPGYSTDAVAQLTFAFILEIYNRVNAYKRLVAEGDWIKSRTFAYFPIPLIELSGKNIGIIGYGAIGQKVGKIADAFGMNVLYNARMPKEGVIGTYCDVGTLLSLSDIVTLHCPLNEQTRKLINAENIAKMKDGASLINTSRGPVVDENALAAALRSGKLSAAGVDVLEQEPMSPDCPLYGVSNCIITPHIAWAGLETRLRLLDIVASNINAFINGTPKNNVAI